MDIHFLFWTRQPAAHHRATGSVRCRWQELRWRGIFRPALTSVSSPTCVNPMAWLLISCILIASHDLLGRASGTRGVNMHPCALVRSSITSCREINKCFWQTLWWWCAAAATSFPCGMGRMRVCGGAAYLFTSNSVLPYLSISFSCSALKTENAPSA